MSIKNKTVLQKVAKETKSTTKKVDAILSAFVRTMTRECFLELIARREDAQLADPRDINTSSVVSNHDVGSFYLRGRKGAAQKEGELATNYLGEQEGYETFNLVFDDSKATVRAEIEKIKGEIAAATVFV